MRTITTTAFLALAVAALVPSSASAQSLHVGEIRQIALAPSDAAGVSQLHQDGWIEAQGQVLEQDAFPELFRAFGRSFSSKRVPSGQFALPDLDGATIDVRNPFHVLDPSDLVTAGKTPADVPVLQRPTISSWIYTGRPVTGAQDGGR